MKPASAAGGGDDDDLPGAYVSNAEAASASASLADVMSDCNVCV